MIEAYSVLRTKVIYPYPLTLNVIFRTTQPDTSGYESRRIDAHAETVEVTEAMQLPQRVSRPAWR